MSKVIQFPRMNRVEKVSIIPRVFTNLFEAYKQKQHDIRKKKIQFLEQQAFQYFYDVQEVSVPKVKKNELDLPYFVQEIQAEKRRREIAQDNASRVMLQVIRDNRINECYSKRVKQLREIAKQTRMIQGK